MSESARVCKCPICDKKMRRDRQAEMLNVGNREYSRPIHSDSLAIHSDQREEHQKRWPDIKLDAQNRPIFDNFQQHEKYLKDCGIVKHRQKKKQKGKKIKISGEKTLCQK